MKEAANPFRLDDSARADACTIAAASAERQQTDGRAATVLTLTSTLVQSPSSDNDTMKISMILAAVAGVAAAQDTCNEDDHHPVRAHVKPIDSRVSQPTRKDRGHRQSSIALIECKRHTGIASALSWPIRVK